MYKKRISIISYGMGNVGSIAHALDYLEGRYSISDDIKNLEQADAFILPGVGAFGAAMENLQNLNLINELSNQVLLQKKPFMGICLGMQLLAIDSTEGGFNTGLGWIEGHVTLLQPEANLRVPHVGWNNVKFDQSSYFFQRIDIGAHFYFDHSYHLQCNENLIISTFEYGGSKVAAIHKENIFAMQFHPEKSQRHGLKILRNFLNFVEYC